LELFENNGLHLKETLKGCCPKWTPEGKRRIDAGQKVKSLRIKKTLESIRSSLKQGESPSMKTISRYLDKLGITVDEASEMVELLGLLPHLLRPKKKRENHR
jgi:hypothetical protein